MRKVYIIFVKKAEGNHPRGRPRYRCEGNKETNLRETEWTGFMWLRTE
jgi:hypothetical protein